MLSENMQYRLLFADGSHWAIAARDEHAASVVSELCHAMGLQASGKFEGPDSGIARRLLVSMGESGQTRAASFRPAEDDGTVLCVLSPYADSSGLYVQLMELSAVIARDAQSRGGILIHGALAEYRGNGVIMAAPGGIGKTTASNRLPSSWTSLSDDTTLVVRDRQGGYQAHPWPTWSRFVSGGPGGSWDVQRAVPLKGIFFLEQASEDLVATVGHGQAVAMLAGSSAQASLFMARDLGAEEVRAMHLQRFENINALIRCLPAHLLHISLTGPFWQQMEKALAAYGAASPRSGLMS